MIQSEIHLSLIDDCQYSCPYCQLGRKQLDKVKYLESLNIVCDTLSKIHPYLYIVLTGGEPGLLPEELLDITFQKLYKKVTLSTNGLFIDNGYLEKYKDYIDLLLIHLTSETYNKDFNIPEEINHVYGVTVTDLKELFKIPIWNFERLKYVALDAEIGETLFSVDLADLDILKQFLQKEAFDYLIKSLKVNEIDRQMCRILNPVPTISLNTGEIYSCLCRKNDVIPLTRENLINVFTQHKNFTLENRMCAGCFGQCLCINSEFTIKQKRLLNEKKTLFF